MTTIIRIARASAVHAARVVLALVAFASPAAADTFMMPKRDALVNANVVIWGITTKPNGTPITINFGDPAVPTVTTTVGDRSYINFTRSYPTPGVKTVTLTVLGPGPVETATVDIQVFAPSGPTAAQVTRQVLINNAIQDGLRWLWGTQSNRTSFDTTSVTNWGRPSFTALVVLAFENHGYRLPNDDSVPAGLYERYVVRRGLNFLMSGFAGLTLTLQPAGNPCAGTAPAAEFTAGGSCLGYFTNAEPAPALGFAGYSTALMILPFAGSGALDRTNFEAGGVSAGRSYREITQRLINAMAFGQNEMSIFNGAGRGGWNYGFNQDRMDGSTAGWNVLAILDAQAAGIPLPSFLVPEFSFGLNNAFNADGSFDYNTDGNPTPVAAGTQNHPTHRNLARSGIGAQAHFLMGGDAADARGTAITNFINSRWSGLNQPNDYLDSCGANNQNKNCAYAMFNVFKGLKLLGVQTLPNVNRPAGPGSIPEDDWYADYQDWLVSNQFQPATPGGGQWNMPFSCCSGTATAASTALGELILSSVALVLPDAGKFATVGLRPATASGTESSPGFPSTHTVIAKAEGPSPSPGQPGPPVPGATVQFVTLPGSLNPGLSFTGVTDANGEVAWTYADSAVPFPSSGIDSIRANIGTLLSNTVTMEWTPFNRPPVANPDDFSVAEDTVLNGNVLANDTDPDVGDTLTAALVTGPAHGTLVLNNSNGTFSYTPAPDYCGPDGFTYDVNDGDVDGNIATVSINVTCVNDAPVANPDAFTIAEDSVLSGPAANVLANDADVDVGDLLNAVLVAGPAHGTLILNGDGTFTYTPLPDFCGDDGFTYAATDGEADSNVASVTIEVTCVNDTPVANPDTFTVAEDGVLTGPAANVLANDADADVGDSLTAMLVSGPAHGTLVLNSNGTFTYTPAPDFCTADAFTYKANDGQADSNVASVTIDVTCNNDAPIAADASTTTAEDTAVTGAVSSTDVDGPSATYAIVTGPAEGTLVLNATTGAYTYTPGPNYNGPDAFTFSVDDGAGGTDTAVVSITVTPVNDLPVCTAAGPSIASLWPPDHALASVTVLGVVDPIEGSTVSIEVDSIFQDEPTDTIGDGNTPIDGFGVGTAVAQLRRERSGSKRVPGDGRMYYINFTGTDAEGGKCTGTVQVGVPHDLGEDHEIGAGGQLYKSTGQ
jgi:VCBS repeat-containing protein